MDTDIADDALLKQVEKLIGLARPIFDHQAQQEATGIWLPKPAVKFEEISAPLSDALKAHPLIMVDGTGDFFAEKQLARHVDTARVHALMKFAHEAGSQAALAWFHKVATVKTASLRYILEVRGLTIASRVVLNNGVVLAPWDEMPESANVRAIANGQLQRPGSHSSFVSSVAVYIEVPDVPGRTNHGDPSGSLAADQAASLLHRTVMALALHGEATPVSGISWIDFVDPDLMRLDVGRMWRGDRTDASAIGSFEFEICETAIVWVNRFLATDEAVQRACDIPLERLAMARTRNSAGNKAIDGAICLEALLGTKSPGDLTHKLSTRAAILLGGTLEERRTTQRAIRDFYGLRSRIVHGNRREIKLKDQEGVRKGLEICGRALQRVVEMNHAPSPDDWDLMGSVE